MHLVGCRWVFKLKHNSDGFIAKQKACLEPKGFHRADYNETFIPVVKHTTIKVVLALAVHFCWPLHQLDVTNTFLHGILYEDIYMTQPHGFVDRSFKFEGSLAGSCFKDPLMGSKTGECGGLTRTTFNLFSSMYLPFSLENCQAKKAIFFGEQSSQNT